MAEREGKPVQDAPMADDPVADFAARLGELRAQAGSPSFRRLAKLTNYSSSALAEATSGRRLPSEALVKAFVVGCGADPAEWLALLDQARTTRRQPLPAAAVDDAESVRVTARGRRWKPLVVIAPGACVMLAAGILLGMIIDPVAREAPVRSPSPAATATAAAATAAAAAGNASDGADPAVAGCTGDARLAAVSPVLLDGRRIGALELRYSARCAAGWARIYLYPGEPSMLGEVTVKAPDGRLAAFAYPMVNQVADYTDVLTPGAGRCLSASAVFYPPGRASVTARITCQRLR